MKIKFFKAPKPKYNKAKLYRIALKEAVSVIALECDERSYQTIYNEIITKAKQRYNKPKELPTL
jgi:hypothetical protein